ncbi:MAG: pyridoxamine 5'-phosphate oxidase family protein [Bacilli bacterium]
MAKRYAQLTVELMAFIQNQKMFFVGTAPSKDGEVNVSPKGYDTLRILNNHTLLYVDYYGSGNETSNHLTENQRITFMWCSFVETPLILRVYGNGKVLAKDSNDFTESMGQFFHELDSRIVRQIFIVNIDSVQTSCGWAVPFMNYVEDRSMLNDMSKKQFK